MPVMSELRKVAIFGASGNFGRPITAALQQAGFAVTVITRPDSSSTFPSGLPVIRTPYDQTSLAAALKGQDAVVCAISPAGLASHSVIVDAAFAAGVKRFVIDHFGWGRHFGGLPEIDKVMVGRKVDWEHAEVLAAENPGFTWTAIASGVSVDRGPPARARTQSFAAYPEMGFDIKRQHAVIYDNGEERFAGTTCEGIGKAVVNVLKHPAETSNRFVTVCSLQTSQNELLASLEKVTGSKWTVEHLSGQSLVENGRQKLVEGDFSGYRDLMLALMFREGQGKCRLVSSRAESDSELLGVEEETPEDVATKILNLAK